ncbi:hypothetical protein D3C85_1594800 [compost metagenome]
MIAPNLSEAVFTTDISPTYGAINAYFGWTRIVPFRSRTPYRSPVSSVKRKRSSAICVSPNPSAESTSI